MVCGEEFICEIESKRFEEVLTVKLDIIIIIYKRFVKSVYRI